MRLKQIKAIDLKEEGRKYDFIFPIGATEQHGPFLPFGTDTYITDYVVDEIEKQFPQVIILPTLEFSRSQEHREFFGTIWLKEETLGQILEDTCKSLAARARNIFLISFHANDEVIKRFIEQSEDSFEGTQITLLEMCDQEDIKNIEQLLGGTIDEHAGNTEISNMLCINQQLVKTLAIDYPKPKVLNPWQTGNLHDQSKSGIADNNPEWIVNEKIGEEILRIYVKRTVTNLNKYLVRTEQ